MNRFMFVFFVLCGSISAMVAGLMIGYENVGGTIVMTGSSVGGFLSAFIIWRRFLRPVVTDGPNA